jgi:ribonuclease HII
MIVGIDEVGRGCWAGPLVAGAVAFDEGLITGLKDSKLLSKKQRLNLDGVIREKAAAFGLGWVTSQEVDQYGLTRAVGLAMERALSQITINFDILVIDGSFNFFPDDPRAQAIVRADQSVPTVSAASIIAKVARDNWMTSEAAKQYPEYQFEKHVGYGTAVHKAQLLRYGVTPLHRQSYKPIRALSSS